MRKLLMMGTIRLCEGKVVNLTADCRMSDDLTYWPSQPLFPLNMRYSLICISSDESKLILMAYIFSIIKDSPIQH